MAQSVMTLTECFRQFGVEIKNPRSAWFGRAPDGRVVITLWTEFFDPDQRIYRTRQNPTLGKRGQWRKRLEVLKQIGIGGTFDSIIIKATDPTIFPWRILERRKGEKMRLTFFNEEGEFDAERVGD